MPRITIRPIDFLVGDALPIFMALAEADVEGLSQGPIRRNLASQIADLGQRSASIGEWWYRELAMQVEIDSEINEP